MDPKVSVLMSVYNGEKFLAESVESILSQTWSDLEFIIVDDGSQDGTWGILQEYSQEDSRIILIRNEDNLGLIRSLNKGLGVAKGEFVARHDADDESYPERLEKQVRFLEQNPDIIAVGSQMLVVNASGRPIRLWNVPLDHREIDFRHVNGFGGIIPHPSLMVRTDMIRELGGYREEFPVGEDVDLLLRLAEAGRLANLPDILVRYRVHEQNVTTLQRERSKASVKLAVYQAWERRGLGDPPFETVPNPHVKLKGGSRAIGLMIYGMNHILRDPQSKEGWSAVISSLRRLAGIK